MTEQDWMTVPYSTSADAPANRSRGMVDPGGNADCGCHSKKLPTAIKVGGAALGAYAVYRIFLR